MGKCIVTIIKDKQNNMINKKRYINQLHDCSVIAEKQANRILIQKLPKIEALLRKSRNNLKKFVQISIGQRDFADPVLEKMLLDFTGSIDSQLNIGLQHMRNSLQNKQKHLSHFTVTLFGKTKAGKSTIREALTSGDGSTIGKGLQRTTRDIREYEWNYLRIIDTPGIGAYEGEDDVAIAESVIDESDVIIFLLTTDGIQESEFEKLVELKSLNKPIVIVLNVKYDITNRIRRKRFFSDWNSIVSEEGQKGHCERIRKYTKEYFGWNKVKIIPIHAQAAFLSTKENDQNMKEKLYESSRLELLKEVLQDMVINEGTQHRIKTFHDAHIFYLNSLSNIYWESYRQIRPRVSYLRKKIKKFNHWFSKYNEQGLDFIDSRVEEIFAPIYAEIGNFVDLYAGKKDADLRWKKKMEQYNIQSKLESISNELREELQNYLVEFTRQLNFEFKTFNFDSQSYGINDVSKGVMGRVARWGGAALGMAEGALFIGSIMNIWNPAGWVMGTLGIAAIAVNVFGWIFGDDTKRHEKEKNKVKRKMTNELQKKEIEIQIEFKKWFRKEIISPIKKQLSNNVNISIKTMEGMLGELEKQSQVIDKEVMSENRELLAELYKQSFDLDIITNLSSISREQGSIMKILYNGEESLFNFKKRKYLEKVLGERIITVSFISDPIELFKRAMFPVSIQSKQIIYDNKNNKFYIKVKKENIGRIIGKNGRHVKTTSKLLNCSIEVQEV
jgi:predicted GTPase